MFDINKTPGSMLVELCSSIPDGVVAFFTSYSYMESIICEWDGMGILRQLTKSKLVFIETKDVVETTLALDNYRRACDSGRGAVFLSVARGKVGTYLPIKSFLAHSLCYLMCYVINFSGIRGNQLRSTLRSRRHYVRSTLPIHTLPYLTSTSRISTNPLPNSRARFSQL